MSAQIAPTAGAKAVTKAPIPRTKADAITEASPSLQPPAGAPTAATQPDAGATAAFIEPELRRAMIAEAAYYRAERRDFEPGHELEDWCLAEGEIDGRLTRGETPAVYDPADLI